MNLGKKLKFLFITSDKFPPFRVDVAVLFGKEIIGRGHKIDFILQSEDVFNSFGCKKWYTSKVFLGPTNNGPKFFNRVLKHLCDFVNDLRMIKLIAKEKYDFIQVKDKFISALVAIFLSKLVNKKIFFWLSYPIPDAYRYGFITKTARYPYLYLIYGTFLNLLLTKIIVPHSTHIFVQSIQMKRDFVLKGFNHNKFTPIPMGIDLDDLQNFDDTDDDPLDEKKHILYLGTMERARRIDFVIKVFKKVLDKRSNTRLYMVGDSEDPKDLQYLKKMAKDLNIDKKITFTGNLPRNKALDYVKKSTVCLSPIIPIPVYYPSSPTKIVEYLLMGKAVVANDIPEQKRILRESNGGICVDYNEEEFADATLKLLLNHKLAKKMGKKGRRYIISNRNYKKIGTTLEKKYLDLISK